MGMTGECRLENMRTLCVACHAEVTKAQGVERLLARKRAREQLKMTMKVLQHFDDGEKKGGFSTLNSGTLEVVGGEASEDMLLVHVPGSAYSESSSGYMGCHSSKSASSSAKQTARWKSTGIVALRDSKLKVLPDDVLEVDTFVRTLDMSNNKVAEIPLDIGKLINMQRLLAFFPDLNGCLFQELVNMLADTIEKLNNLSLLNVSRNKLRTLPPSIGGCTSLEELQANALGTASQNLLKCCQALQNLSLHGNVITMDQLQQMEGFEEFEQRRRKKFDKQINSMC
ncbi:hypothetical protein HPP92_012973 [Vanilla planifolia]|uniref:Uncharacterized protein n=1 Tax=Vanilla planifolia TaxID=51239 RepID=A0A835UWB7_VANPL|nr:hypothetical protein HPP92_012973 [Vanilla planifolia]